MTVPSGLAFGKERAVRVLVVDDHALVADTLLTALSASADLVVDSAGNLETAGSRIKRAGRYDVILLDYDLPDSHALDGFDYMMKANSGNVALLSGVVRISTVERALDKGARGFVPKTMSLKSMLHAIRHMAMGGIYLPGDILNRMRREDVPDVRLKPRERLVLGFLNEGMRNKEIGREVGIEENLVKMDVRSICRKLGARNRTQAVLEARKLDII